MTSRGIPSSRNNHKGSASTAKPSLQSSQKTSPRIPEDNAYQMIQNRNNSSLHSSISMKGSDEPSVNP